MNKKSGFYAEDIASKYLVKLGMDIIDRNIHCRFGELDIIALDKQCLVFIEVRYRKNEYIMSALESIDYNKVQKLITSSSYYLTTHPKYKEHTCRYDVISLTGDLNKPDIKWIKNAFQA